MLPRQIIPLISYNGKSITEDITPYLVGLSYTDGMSGYADSLTIMLEDRKGIWSSDWFPDRGATLDVALAARNWEEEGITTMDVGLFSIDSIDGSSPPSQVSLKAVSVPENNELRGVDRTRSWEKAELKTIANDVAMGAGLELAYDNGLALKIYKNQVVIFDEIEYEKVEPTIIIVKPGTTYEKKEGMHYVKNITGYRLHAVTRDIYKACHVQCNDSDSGNTIESTFTDPNKTDGKTLEVKEQVKTIPEAEKLAKKKLREKNRDEWTMTIDTMGDFYLVAAMTVNVTGFGKFDGKYIITEAKHDLGNGYTTSVELRRCLDGY